MYVIRKMKYNHKVHQNTIIYIAGYNVIYPQSGGSNKTHNTHDIRHDK